MMAGSVFTPLLVLALGRSGTTYLMRLLSHHPQIVAHQQYPLELRLFQFAIFPEIVAASRKSIERRTYRFPNDEELFYGPFRRDGTIPLSNVWKSYAVIQAGYGKEGKYVSEKFPPWADLAKARVECPNLRAITLVRDPRDVLLSARAFDVKRGFHGFREREGDTDERVVLKYRQGFETLLKNMEAAAPAIVVRYEDLVLQPHPTLGQVFDQLQLETRPAVLDGIVDKVRSAGTTFHATSISSAASVNRWKREMSAELHVLFDRHFGSILDRFHYERWRHSADA